MDLARRTALIVAIALAHLLAILWLATRQELELPPQSQGGLTLIDVSGGGEAVETKPPVEPAQPETSVPPIALEVQELVEPPGPIAESASEAMTGSGGEGAPGGCALASEIGQAIQRNRSAMTELAAMPQGMRTSADAVMLWDGRWLAIQGVAAGALRKAAAETIIAAPAECRDAPLLGPQLVPIAEPGRTTMVVFGSGAWRWADLLRPDACSAENAASCIGQMSPARRSAPHR